MRKSAHALQRRTVVRPALNVRLAAGAQTRDLCPGITEIGITVNAGGAPHWMAIKNQELFASAVRPRVPAADAVGVA